MEKVLKRYHWLINTNPIWNSDVISEFDVTTSIMFYIFVTHFGGWLVASLICLNVTL